MTNGTHRVIKQCQCNPSETSEPSALYEYRVPCVLRVPRVLGVLGVPRVLRVPRVPRVVNGRCPCRPCRARAFRVVRAPQERIVHESLELDR